MKFVVLLVLLVGGVVAKPQLLSDLGSSSSPNLSGTIDLIKGLVSTLSDAKKTIESVPGVGDSLGNTVGSITTILNLLLVLLPLLETGGSVSNLLSGDLNGVTGTVGGLVDEVGAVGGLAGSLLDIE